MKGFPFNNRTWKHRTDVLLLFFSVQWNLYDQERLEVHIEREATNNIAENEEEILIFCL